MSRPWWTKLRSPWRVLLTAFVMGITLTGASSSYAAQQPARRHMQPLVPGHERHALPVRPDQGAILPGSPAAGRAARYRTRFSTQSASATVSDGTRIGFEISTSYVLDPALVQGWADFFGDLPHGDELGYVTIVVATQSEVQEVCGEQALACYAPQDENLFVPGDGTADGTPTEPVAAHEYGHHVANNRDNDPWDAGAWGPKYWASYEGVCIRTALGEVFPGDEGDNYTLNPGEAWAETYRALASGDDSWDLVDPSFAPDQTDLALASQDVTDPWAGNRTRRYSGRFHGRGHHYGRLRIAVPVNGRVTVAVRSQRGLDVDLFLYDSTDKHLLGRARRGGATDQVRALVCTGTSAVLYTSQYRGSGSYRLSVSAPRP